MRKIKILKNTEDDTTLNQRLISVFLAYFIVAIIFSFFGDFKMSLTILFSGVIAIIISKLIFKD